jgi:6-phosphogluconolactonase
MDLGASAGTRDADRNRAGVPDEHFFETAEEMFRTLEAFVAARLNEGIAARGAASLVLPGGGTPHPLYDRLAQHALDWHRVHIVPSDERWISPEDPRSNENLIRSRLCVAKAERARLVCLKTDDAMPEAAEPNADAALAAMPRPFDAVLLGMGVDGHTASLIPRAPQLASALDPRQTLRVRAIDPPNADLGRRMTLTLHALLDARVIAIIVRGERKLGAYRIAMAGGDSLEMPVRAVLKQSGVPVKIFWAP